MYKEMIEVLEGIKIKFENQGLGFSGATIKDLEAFSKAITIAKAFDNVEMPERKEEGSCQRRWKEGSMNIVCGEELPCSKHSVDKENTGYKGFNKALDLVKPLIVKKDIRIKGLEKLIAEYQTNYNILFQENACYQRENSKLKERVNKLDKENTKLILSSSVEELEKLKQEIEEFRRISKIGLEYELANYKRLRRAYEDSEQQLQASKEEIEKAKENWLALWDEKQNLIESLVAMKDKMSEKNLVAFLRIVKSEDNQDAFIKFQDGWTSKRFFVGVLAKAIRKEVIKE